MGFRINVIALLFLILADAIFTIVRPTTSDYSDTMNVDVLDYVLIAAHGVTTICQAVTIFILFSSTVWFTAGLLGELFMTAKWTMLIWFLRLIFVAVPWVHRRFIGDLGDRAMEDRDYRFLFVGDLLLAVANWAALMFTASCMTEKRMYSPYHKETIRLPAVAYSNQQISNNMMMNNMNNMNISSSNQQQQQQPQPQPQQHTNLGYSHASNVGDVGQQ